MSRCVVLVALLVVCNTSCDDPEKKKKDPGPLTRCDAVEAAFAECGLNNDGFAFDHYGCEDASDCVKGCLLEASCDDLATWYCAPLTVDGDFKACLDVCDPPFVCDGHEVAENFLCDTENDCTDASDEDGCDYLECDGGDEYSLLFVCNGFEECADHSDEAGCDLFTCGDTSSVPARYECDGVNDCPDGTDDDEHCYRTRLCGEPPP